jgi:hypothetical protein
MLLTVICRHHVKVNEDEFIDEALLVSRETIMT